MTLINFALASIHVEIYYSKFYSNDNLMPVRVRLDERQAEIGSSIIALSPYFWNIKIILYSVTS